MGVGISGIAITRSVRAVVRVVAVGLYERTY